MNEADRRRQESYKNGTLNSDSRRATRSANSSPVTYLQTPIASSHQNYV